MLPWIGIYIGCVLVVYLLRRGAHTRMKYYTQVRDQLFEDFFGKFQQAIVTYDDAIYRSDKAYPILTKPLDEWLQGSSHSLAASQHILPILREERTTLQTITKQHIGENPLKGVTLSNQGVYRERTQRVVWWILVIITCGVRAIYSMR